MKKMTFKRSKLGFTLAELLLVIAIIAILVALGVTGFVALRQNIIIAKYDDIAREIYVAAQNQLIRMEANGLDQIALNALNDGTAMLSQPSDYEGSDWDTVKGDYHYALKSDNQPITVLLPLGTVADSVRTNGFYTIEYNVKTRTVYGVFYSDEKFNYAEDYIGVYNNSDPKFRKERSVRKKPSNGPMVGYYGGSAVKRDPLTHLDAPKLEIINENELRLNILDVPTDVTKISVRISDGTKSANTKVETVEGESGKRTVLLDSILEKDKHFHQLFPDLTPGKDLDITVVFEKTGAISSSASISANSLFATREYATDGDVVTIAWARHLQNLENSVSHLDDNGIIAARQTEHIQWDKDKFGKFVSITNAGTNDKLLRFEGSNLEIRDLNGTNGLFAVTKEWMDLSGIRIVNPVIEAEGTAPVGALVGTAASKTTIHLCGVYANKLSSDKTVDYDQYQNCYVDGKNAVTGGLVGKATNATVTSSFAALPILKGGSGAALIGSASGCTISDSYANCDDLAPSFMYFVRGGGEQNTINHCYAVGNSVTETAGAFAFTGESITDCYYAVSHREFAKKWEDNKDLAATQFCYFENGNWLSINQEQMQKAIAEGWAKDKTWANMIAPLSHPYREYLNGRAFPYPAIAELDHYGSWPDGNGTVDLKIDMTLLNNTDAGYAVFAGKVVVTKPDGTELFNSDDHKNSDGTFDGENIVKVIPGTEVTITITSADGYKYLYTVIDGKTNYPTAEQVTAKSYEVKHTVNRDTEAVVTFQQEAFKLTGIPAVDQDGKNLDHSTYSIDLTNPMKTIVIADAEQWESVETGSTVTVRPNVPQGYMASVVWYQPEGNNDAKNRTYLISEADGSYTFDMPAEPTEVHVMYTKEEVDFNIQYYLMDTEGQYPATPTQSTTYKCGLGSQINQAMINALAESSWLTVTIENERVLYLAEGIVTTNAGDEVFHSTVDVNGTVTTTAGPHTTESTESKYNIKIYIARKQYDVTLIADEHISGVHFEEADTPVPRVTRRFYYGANVTARAEVEAGYSFTYWDPQNDRFMMSAEPDYTFQVPHFNLYMKATATTNQHLVTINLLENGESWLFSSESRKADPITLTLVNSKDGKTYPMKVLTEDTISYAMQAVVPAVSEYEVGYYVRVDYDSDLTSWIYTSGDEKGTDENNTKLLLHVRDKAVVATAEFYSVTYHPNAQTYVGTVPKGGTYPMYYHLMVEGNSGMLRNLDDPDIPKFFCGWKDYYAEGTGSNVIYDGDDVLMVTRRTDVFAQWEDSLHVVYDGNGADGGELPLDLNKYENNAEVTVKFSNITRKGYNFLGWSETEDADSAEYTETGTKTFQITKDNVTLYAVWEPVPYTVQFCDTNGNPLTGEAYNFTDKHYDDKITAPAYPTHTVEGEAIIGWSLTKGGEIVCRAGEEYTVTGNAMLYACTFVNRVTVTYNSDDGTTRYDTEEFGMGIPAYLTCIPEIDGKKTPVTAWSTLPNGKGELYLCDENGRSERTHAFTKHTDLYAVTGKVYNYNKQLWFNTLYDAVRSNDTEDGHTLIVYRNTEESHRIVFNKNLYALSHGNRTVKWERLGDDVQGEFVGCMNVSKGGGEITVEFGRSDISTLSMEDSTLTFDANRQSRVISLRSGATFHMYDGITLTNGYRYDKDRLESGNGKDDSNLRSLFGGGVYAGGGAVFYMHGGTVSFCEAISGGGVYLYVGSKMYMGDMVQPKAFSATAIYYSKTYNEELQEDIYKNVEGVTVENYKNFYITAGEPQICYNSSDKTGDRDGGGGLLMLDLYNGDLTLFRGSIIGNSTGANGGGIMTDSGDNNDFLRIYEVDISHNTATNNGGGIFQWQGTVYIYNSTIRQNQAKRGGGIYLNQTKNQTYEETCNIEFYFGDISDNNATALGNEDGGGGVFAQGKAKLLIDGGNLLRNNARYGGGAYLKAGSTLDFKKGTIADNTVLNDGGAVYSLGTVNLSGGTMSDNYAGFDGGAIWSNGIINMTGGTICNNNARCLGGGILVYGTFNLSGGSFYGNNDKDNWREPAYADEDNEHPGRNDIYLMNYQMITVPRGGIKLSGEERVVVDCDNDASLRFDGKGLPRQIVQYPYDGFKPEDVYYFTYFGTRSTEYSIETLGKNNLTVKTHAQFQPPLRDTGLYLDVETADKNSSYVIFNLNYEGCKVYQPILTEVGTDLHINQQGIDTTRSGYYLAGWARTPDAIEEQYALYYDVVENVWKSNYVSGTGWKNTLDEPSYTVQDLYSQTLYAMWRPCVVVYDVTTEAANAGVTVQPTSVGPSVTLLTPSSLEYTNEKGETLHFKHWKNAEDKADNKEYKPMQQLELTKNLRLKAVWESREADKVVFTFHFNSGTSDQTGEMRREVEVVKGTEYKIDVVIRQANKILVGWNTKSDGTGTGYATDDTITAQGNMDLYAVWANALTLTYDPNGGFGNSWVVTAQEGIDVTITDRVPLRDGYAFLGWSLDPNATTASYTEGKPFRLNEHTTLYAVWKKDDSVHYCTVSYNLGGGTGEGFGTVHVLKDTSITIPNAPTRAGYVFGWWEDVNGTHYNAGDTLHVTNDTTLKAIWKCFINIDLKGGTWNGEMVSKEILMTENTVFYLKSVNATRVGHILKGWATTNTATIAEYGPNDLFIVKNGLTLYAVWAETVNITFDFNDGDPTEDVVKIVEKGSAYKIDVTPTREGYTFKGWSTDPAATTVEHGANATLTPEADMTLYAVWEQTVTITFNYNYTGSPEDVVKTVEKGTTYQIDVVPTRKGYTFKGWSTDKNAKEAQYTTTINANENMTLYAVWEQKTWTITFELYGGSWGVPKLEYTVLDGESFPIPNEIPEKRGMTFMYWSTGTDDIIKSGTSVNVTSDMVFKAVWGYKITFNLKGGNIDGKTDSLSVLLKPNETYSLNWDKKPTRDGYDFKGWSKKKNGSSVDYGTNQSITANENMTLYAVWSEQSWWPW